ncbi:MAG: 7-cyano-7-deazaguanine synthase QueC [Candidatus Latescibacterota bacterium]
MAQDTSTARGPAVLLLSGGMDSATLLWWLARQGIGPVHTLSVDYGQRHRAELAAAAALAQRAEVAAHTVVAVDLGAIGGSPLTNGRLAVPAASDHRQIATVVPFRNLLFVCLAAAYAEAQGIGDLYLAPVRDDYHSYRDCRRPFCDSVEQTLRLGAPRDSTFRVHTPFVDRWKTEVVSLGLELGVPYAQTHTCYEGRRPACGVCDACAERIAAFRGNRVPDPLPYEVDVDWGPPGPG